MRQLLLNHARDRARLKRGAGVSHLELEPNHVTIAFEAEQVIAIDQALHALAREDERMVRIVECRIFAGLSDEETARALDLPLRTCQRLWALARTRIDVLLSD
jgi:DNA-directed RNA polymerase specialized sigma24 family protein